ncbi:MAG: hypothetical protein GXY76_20620 [Chloroflexi bacterium]|nr:hypothetical protein [Chloroflexota bacterium]
MYQLGLFTETGTTHLADAAMEILERVGVLCQNVELLQALAAWGARVDRTSQMARFPRPAVEAFAAALRRETGSKRSTKLETVQQDYSVAASGSAQVATRLRAPDLPSLGTQVAQFYLDHRTGERRSGTRADLLTLIRLGEALHGPDGVGHSLLLQDVPPLLEPLEAALLLAENASRPAGAFAWNVRQVDYLIEMGEVLGIPNWYTLGAICFSHPLRFDQDVADRFVRRVKDGAPTGITGMQVSGATTPVTAAGYVAVSAAEFVAAWIAARALNPAVPLVGSIWGGTVDMKTGFVSYCSPDGMLRAFALAEFLRRWCGQHVVVGGGEYCDARMPGRYAALEKAYKAMTIAAFTGAHPMVGEGMLESGKTISPVQLMLDREYSLGVQMLAGEIEVTPETIGMDAILEVGQGLDTSYLQTSHTLQHYRDNLWLPSILSRTGWNGYEEEEIVLARARRKVEELIASYRQPQVDPAKLAQLQRIVSRARQRLLSD